MGDNTEELGQNWYDHKSKIMTEILGPEHDSVMHSVVPYAIGGNLDLYYYPHGIPGTAIATKELSDLPNVGSSNKLFSCYELVMFTRLPIDLAVANDEKTPFGHMNRSINLILYYVARYSAETELNPGETCEFPEDFEAVGGKCLIFDKHGHQTDDVVESFGLLAIIEIFRSEMDFARDQGSSELFTRLKACGHHPYSDLDRAPVA
jgi:Suppressor of fused protein (SUFU)